MITLIVDAFKYLTRVPNWFFNDYSFTHSLSHSLPFSFFLELILLTSLLCGGLLEADKLKVLLIYNINMNDLHFLY